MQSVMECATEQTEHKMSSNSALNDVKTLFLIINTLNGLIAGLLPLSILLAILLTRGPSHEHELVFFAVTGVVTALPMLSITALGYHGAIIANKILLYIYSVMMALTTLAYVAAAVAFGVPLAPGVFGFLHCFIMLGAVALSVVLAKQAAKDGRPNALPPCSKCLIISLVVISVLYAGYIYKLFFV